MNGDRILHLLLWVAVLGWGIVFGGLLLETVWIVPLWSGALPGSLTSWNINPQHVFDPTSFYRIFTSSTVLAMVGIWIIAWKTPERWQKWLVAASICAVAAIVFTYIYFIPRNIWLFQRHGSGLTAEQITTLGNNWVVANWFRLTLIGMGFFFALYGFRNSSQTYTRS